MRHLLTRYWITFDEPPTAPWQLRLARGCGVTAYSYEDAIALLQTYMVEEFQQPLPPIKTVIADIDISTLDTNHVLPNIGVPVWRGVWFPLRSLWYC